MELLHGADNEQLPMPVFTLPPTPRAPLAWPLTTTVRTRSPVPAAGVIPHALPLFPESFWTFLGRAWFFVAGVTIGVFVAATLVAIAVPKARAAHQRVPAAKSVTNKSMTKAATKSAVRSAAASKLVVVGPALAAVRAVGEARAVPEAAPSAPTRPVVRRRTAVAPHKHSAKAGAVRRPSGRDLLSAGL